MPIPLTQLAPSGKAPPLPAEVRALHPVFEALRGRLEGEARCDALSRSLYSTDASIYEIAPLGVVFPRTTRDVITVVEACRNHGASIVPRGGGTGLTGGAVGPGVQLDLSRYMTRIGTLDPAARSIEVEPGVVLDELNAHVAPHGLQFAPDVATSSRATIGGMIANNSCGAHSVIYGRTVDHVLELTVVLADGSVATFGRDAAPAAGGSRSIEAELARIRDAYFEEIERRFPRILRSNGGYGLDRLGTPGTPARALKVLCGSEGTLGIVVAARLKLTPLPRYKTLVVLHFGQVLDALDVTPAILCHQPAAVELIDRLILDGGRANLALAKRCDFLVGDPSALLVVEFFGDDPDSLRSRVEALLADAAVMHRCQAASQVLEPGRQADVWNLRKSGLGLLMSRPGDLQPNAFVEDTAVDPARLREYIARFGAVLEREGVTASYYAHASVGCLHVRPAVNLTDAGDVARMRRIAEAVCDLVLEFGGAVTGEHGDGIVRSCWIERMYGTRIVAAFQEVKRLFDPHGLLNPHKIVDPWPMTEHLRRTASPASRQIKTHLDFSAHGGLGGLAGMCSGVGQCRQRLVGTMCPSYMATGDETHTTRARANALRVALSDAGLLSGLDDPHLADVMDLCLSCKACKTECPTGVDMARLKTEYLAQRNLREGATRQARFIADFPELAARGARFPRLSNLIAQSRPARALVKRLYGLDRRVPPPRFANRTFHRWYDAHTRSRPQQPGPRGTVVYFVDTWTNYFAPQVGIAAVRLLEAAGFHVYAPRLFCCGRPAISKGLLADARELAQANLLRLARIAPPGTAIVGTEPSCILTLLDEYPQLVRTPVARRIASQVMMIETLLRRLIDEERSALPLSSGGPGALLYHAHCHQKALVGSEDAAALIRHVWGAQGSEINSGCCGMAGSFGHEVQHYDVARAIGEQRLFPAVRGRGGADIAVSGFSCRQQIEHHTGVRPRHLVELLADRLEA
ncbi:MAG: FAD-binding protein [Planctomycetes bacterium]|nr:FAD-binding protein [Planctomycetota bacterium]